MAERQCKLNRQRKQRNVRNPSDVRAEQFHANTHQTPKGPTLRTLLGVSRT
jgi:hypothetical protein